MDDNQLFTWFVGVFEGEGSFYFRNNIGKGLTIVMTDLDVLERVQSIVGGSIYTLKKREAHWKDAWKWQIGGVKSADLARKMLPFLCSRRAARCEEYITSFQGTEAYLAKKKADAEYRGRLAARLRDEGLTQKEIANTLSIDRSTVSKLLTKYGD